MKLPTRKGLTIRSSPEIRVKYYTSQNNKREIVLLTLFDL
uniref:Uncharacterized protein n=1 Tax=Arundo donax TaxID=35708 RepID=A0A0A9F9Q5_ARUDO